jgi:protein SCO1/2
MSPAGGPAGGARDERFLLTGIAVIGMATAAWWALALWPVGDDGPAWLLRTRYVCFGVSQSGLPDTAGWVGLIGQPLGMLAALLAGWWRGIPALAARVRHSAAARGVSVALCALLVLAGTAAANRIGDLAATPAAFDAREPPLPPRLERAAPPLALVDQHGTRRALADLRGRIVLLTFAYAHCATVCPVLVRDALGAQATLRDETSDGGPAVLVVTLDPWRDTPARLPHIARAWGMPSDAYLVGGGVAEVEAVLDAWSVPRTRDPSTGEITHASIVYVLDEGGRIAYMASGGGARALAELVRRL